LSTLPKPGVDGNRPSVRTIRKVILSSQLTNLSVLVLDDHRFMQQILRAILQGLGIRNIVVVSDINEATSYVINNRFDLILADFRLEGDSTGADFIKVVRASYEGTDRFVPIIACTADTTPAVIQRLRDAGVDEVVAKPISADALWKKIVAVVNNRRSFIATSHFFGPDRRRREVRVPRSDRRKPA
jgi:two-component system, chemotaxis family, chemotaxis protein CheY